MWEYALCYVMLFRHAHVPTRAQPCRDVQFISTVGGRGRLPFCLLLGSRARRVPRRGWVGPRLGWTAATARGILGEGVLRIFVIFAEIKLTSVRHHRTIPQNKMNRCHYIPPSSGAALLVIHFFSPPNPADDVHHRF